MQVSSVRFTNQDQNEVEVVSDLGDFYLPWPCHTWHRQAIYAWLEAGNQVRSFHRSEDAKALRECLRKDVYQTAARLLDGATADYAISEQIVWPDLEREARAFLLNANVGPLMQAELGEGGRSEEELAYAIIHKANLLNNYRGAVIAARARHLQAIEEADIGVLESYEVERGWPDPRGTECRPR